jgi:hypothetical protein
MNKVAVIVPTHFQKIGHLHSLYQSYLNNLKWIDLYPVITTSDYPKYKDLYDLKFIVCNTFDGYDLNSYVVTYKKYYGINYLIKNYKYEYFVTIDSDTLFLDLKEIIKKCTYIYKNKQIIGSRTVEPIYRKINIESFGILNENRPDNIDFGLYFWFSNFPVYRRNEASSFLKHIRFESSVKFIELLNWHIFDYIPYVYWLIIHHDFKLIDGKYFGFKKGYLVEDGIRSKYSLNLIQENDAPIFWQRYNFKTIINDNIIMLFHTDREKTDREKTIRYIFGLYFRLAIYWAKNFISYIRIQI